MLLSIALLLCGCGAETEASSLREASVSPSDQQETPHTLALSVSTYDITDVDGNISDVQLSGSQIQFTLRETEQAYLCTYDLETETLLSKLPIGAWESDYYVSSCFWSDNVLWSVWYEFV
jgi:hypothetical protein